MPKLMNKTERDFVRKKIASFYKKNNGNYEITYKHFMDESISRSTITRTLTRLKQTGTVNTKSPTGMPMKKTILMQYKGQKK